jgi:hypothetical protein
MDLIKAANMVRGMNEQMLMAEMQQPSGHIPQFMIMSEMKRRKDMRATMQQPVDTTPVSEEMMLNSGVAATPQMSQGGGGVSADGIASFGMQHAPGFFEGGMPGDVLDFIYRSGREAFPGTTVEAKEAAERLRAARGPVQTLGALYGGALRTGKGLATDVLGSGALLNNAAANMMVNAADEFALGATGKRFTNPAPATPLKDDGSFDAAESKRLSRSPAAPAPTDRTIAGFSTPFASEAQRKSDRIKLLEQELRDAEAVGDPKAIAAARRVLAEVIASTGTRAEFEENEKRLAGYAGEGSAAAAKKFWGAGRGRGNASAASLGVGSMPASLAVPSYAEYMKGIPDTESGATLPPIERPTVKSGSEFLARVQQENPDVIDPMLKANEKRLAGMDARKADAVNHALMAAGLGMMAGKSRSLLANLGEGGVMGLKQYTEGLKDISKDRAAAQQHQDALIMAKQAAKMGNFKLAEEIADRANQRNATLYGHDVSDRRAAASDAQNRRMFGLGLYKADKAAETAMRTQLIMDARSHNNNLALMDRAELAAQTARDNAQLVSEDKRIADATRAKIAMGKEAENAYETIAKQWEATHKDDVKYIGKGALREADKNAAIFAALKPEYRAILFPQWGDTGPAANNSRGSLNADGTWAK